MPTPATANHPLKFLQPFGGKVYEDEYTSIRPLNERTYFIGRVFTPLLKRTVKGQKVWEVLPDVVLVKIIEVWGHEIDDAIAKRDTNGKMNGSMLRSLLKKAYYFSYKRQGGDAGYEIKFGIYHFKRVPPTTDNEL